MTDESGFDRWSQWTSCSRTCKTGKRQRERVCIFAGEEEAQICNGPLVDSEPCNENVSCPGNANFFILLSAQ